MGTGCSKHQGGFRSCGISSLTWGTEHVIRVKINTLSRLEETQNKPQQAFPYSLRKVSRCANQMLMMFLYHRVILPTIHGCMLFFWKALSWLIFNHVLHITLTTTISNIPVKFKLTAPPPQLQNNMLSLFGLNCKGNHLNTSQEHDYILGKTNRAQGGVTNSKRV